MSTIVSYTRTGYFFGKGRDNAKDHKLTAEYAVNEQFWKTVWLLMA